MGPISVLVTLDTLNEEFNNFVKHHNIEFSSTGAPKTESCGWRLGVNSFNYLSCPEASSLKPSEAEQKMLKKRLISLYKPKDEAANKGSHETEVKLLKEEFRNTLSTTVVGVYSAISAIQKFDYDERTVNMLNNSFANPLLTLINKNQTSENDQKSLPESHHDIENTIELYKTYLKTNFNASAEIKKNHQRLLNLLSNGIKKENKTALFIQEALNTAYEQARRTQLTCKLTEEQPSRSSDVPTNAHANCTRDSYRGSGEVAVDKALERLKIEKALRKPPKAIEPDTSSSIAVKAKAFSPETQQQKSQASYPYKAPSPSTPDIWIPPWEQK